MKNIDQPLSTEKIFHLLYERVRLFPYFPQGLEGGGDPAVGRVYDRLLELCVPVCFRGESQRQALEGLLRGLEGQAAEAAETARRLCRVYLALGLAAGLFCLILL